MKYICSLNTYLQRSKEYNNKYIFIKLQEVIKYTYNTTYARQTNNNYLFLILSEK